MRKFIVLTLFLLAACSTTTGQLTDAERAAMGPQHYVFAARLDYNRLINIVDVYAGQPACSEVVLISCSETVVVGTALLWLVEADEALDIAEVIVRGGGATPDDLLAVSRAALVKLAAYLVAKEITQ